MFILTFLSFSIQSTEYTNSVGWIVYFCTRACFFQTNSVCVCVHYIPIQRDFNIFLWLDSDSNHIQILEALIRNLVFIVSPTFG